MKYFAPLLLGTVITGALMSHAVAQDSRPSVEGRPPFAERGPGPGHRGRGPDRIVGNLINRADTNDDGLVTEAELVALETANVDIRFERRDRNQDGSLDREEAGEREPRPRPGLDIDIEALRACIAEAGGREPEDVDRFDAADLNDDGLLSYTEFVTALEERAYVLFTRLDANQDGFISEAELDADREHQHTQREIVKACMEELRSPL